MIATITGFITSAITLIIGTIVRGIASILVMALAAFIWKRVNAWKGTFHARPTTILFFPVFAAALLLVYLFLFVLRLTLWAFPAAFLALLLGLAIGALAGTTTHIYNTRWNRIMIVSRGRLLSAWFGSMILAAFFRILPQGWLSTPTMALFLMLSVAVIAAHAFLYLRWKEFQVKGHLKVDGPRIEIELDAEETAVFAAFLDLFGPRQAPIPPGVLAAAIRSGARPKQDMAFGLLPDVKTAWEALATAPDRITAVADRLDAKGLFAPGIRPGPAAARLLEIGSITRTITLGGAVFDADGRAATDERTRVIVQAGGVNLLFDARGGMIRLEEIDGARMLEAMQEAFLTPAHRELIHPD
jgi:hypothetical protein